MPHWIVTWADWCGAMFTFATNLIFLQTKRYAEIQWADFAISDWTSRKLCTNINQPYLTWTAVLRRHAPSPKDQGDWDPQSKKMRRYRKKRSRRSPWWREVVQRWSSAGQLNFNYNKLVAVSTNIGLCDINNCGTRDSTNFRTTATKNFYEKLKRLVGGMDLYGYQR